MRSYVNGAGRANGAPWSEAARDRWLTMFLRLVSDSFTRRPRQKLLTGAALALAMAVATAVLSVSLDVGDRLAREFRSLGANLLVTPEADSLPLEIGGVDYRPANAGAYLPESDLPKIKSIFWHNNIVAFAPVLEVAAQIASASPRSEASRKAPVDSTEFLGTWAGHLIRLQDGTVFVTGIAESSPWWHVRGRWFRDEASECVVGENLAKRLQLSVGDHLALLRPVDSDRGAWSMELTVVGIADTGGPEDDKVIGPLATAQSLADRAGQYRKLYVSALTKPEDDFARRDVKTMSGAELERWSCTPYISSIAYQIRQVLPGAEVRVIRRVAEGEGVILTRVRALLGLVTAASLLAAALAVGASSAASVIERRSEIGLMKALGAASGMVGLLLVAEQLLLALVGGGLGYALGVLLARVLGRTVFGVAPEPSFLVLAVVLALAAAVTLLGSALPLRRAARYEPAPILRGE
jgi:putative ABC transport system permease protein